MSMYLDTTTDNKPFHILDVPRINEEAKALWLAALESEEYKDKQGRYALQTHDGNFCCLGVYCKESGVPTEVRGSTWRVPGSNPHNYIEVDMIFFGVGNEATQTLIPTGYEIPWADMEAGNRARILGNSNGFTGYEDLFIARSQDHSDFLPNGTAWSLPKLNDAGFTFTQIADIIRYFL